MLSWERESKEVADRFFAPEGTELQQVKVKVRRLGFELQHHSKICRHFHGSSATLVSMPAATLGIKLLFLWDSCRIYKLPLIPIHVQLSNLIQYTAHSTSMLLPERTCLNTSAPPRHRYTTFAVKNAIKTLATMSDKLQNHITDLIHTQHNDNSHLVASISAQPSKPEPECQATLDVAAARKDGDGGDGDNRLLIPAKLQMPPAYKYSSFSLQVRCRSCRLTTV